MPNILKTHKKGFFEFQTITFGSQRSPFALQRRLNWSAKVALLECKSSPSGELKLSFCKEKESFSVCGFCTPHPTNVVTLCI